MVKGWVSVELFKVEVELVYVLFLGFFFIYLILSICFMQNDGEW